MDDASLLPPSRSREGSGVGTVEGVRRPTVHAQQLRREATPAERRWWQQLNASKLGTKFSRQMPVGPYICDFLSRAARLAIELDGDSHAATVACDLRRTQFIETRGVSIIRFSNADLMGNLEGVAAAILTTLADRPPPTPPASGMGAT